jgi:hypothetical protein
MRSEELSRRTPAERVTLALTLGDRDLGLFADAQAPPARPARGCAAARAPPSGGTPPVPMSRGADRLSLLGPVTGILTSRNIRFVLIGAAAMAVHGVSRSTGDVDLTAG